MFSGAVRSLSSDGILRSNIIPNPFRPKKDLDFAMSPSGINQSGIQYGLQLRSDGTIYQTDGVSDYLCYTSGMYITA